MEAERLRCIRETQMENGQKKGEEKTKGKQNRENDKEKGSGGASLKQVRQE